MLSRFMLNNSFISATYLYTTAAVQMALLGPWLSIKIIGDYIARN